MIYSGDANSLKLLFNFIAHYRFLNDLLKLYKLIILGGGGSSSQKNLEIERGFYLRE